MGGMWPTAQTLRAYDEAKAQAPKAFADANAAIARASALSGAIAREVQGDARGSRIRETGGYIGREQKITQETS